MMSNILTLRNDRTHIAHAALLFPVCACVISGSSEYMIACCLFLGLGEGNDVLFGFRKTEKSHVLLYLTDPNISHQQERNFRFG